MTDHLEAIIHLPNILNPEFCKRIKTFIDKKAKNNLKIGGGFINKNVRNVSGHHLKLDTPTNLFYWNYIKQEIERLIIYYSSKFPLRHIQNREMHLAVSMMIISSFCSKRGTAAFGRPSAILRVPITPKSLHFGSFWTLKRISEPR